MQIVIQDQVVGGPITNEMVLEFLTEEVTLRELIKARVYQEVKDANSKPMHEPIRIVQISSTEKELNSPKKPKHIEFKEEFKKAIEAFEKNRYFVLVDSTQPAKLDDTIRLRPDTRVNFIKLVYLTGG